ncbi:MAG: FAD-binding domain [Roseiarcus sp.]|uniref:FAD-binding domain n=1 Tax=Roseiarcus sp. TaxID=1969460 RepID=UPI003C62B512
MRSKTVLISGAGVAGPTLAYWLNAAGFETTIVERAPRLRTGGYVIDFWGLGYDIAERMGLAAGLGSVGYHIREFRVVGGQGQRLAGFGTKAFDALTGGRFITLRRSDLSKLLLEAADSSSEVLFDDEIVSLREQTDSVRVQFRVAGERDFDLVVGADGLSSNVRTLAFGPQAQFEKRLGYSVAAFEVQGYRPRDKDVYVIHNEPGRMVGRVALRNDRTLFLFVFADDDPRPSPHDFATQRRILQATFGSARWECAQILDRLDDVTELYFDRVSQIKMDKWSHGRVALVGDAAFCVSLLAGQGSALAMTAAYALGGELAKADGDYHAAFRAYERLLRPFIAKKQKGAERFSAAFAPRTGWGLLLRNQVVKACAIPAVARFAFSRDITDTLRLPDYVWPALERIR